MNEKNQTAPDWMKVRKAVGLILDDYHVIAPPINPVEIARNHGVKVVEADFTDADNNISGFYDFHENMIYVNQNQPLSRKTFTVAHELGHHILHREYAQSKDYKMFFRDSNYDGDDFYEKEANAFAAHLLVPRRYLDIYYKDYSLETLAKFFAVSVSVIKNRINFEYGHRY